MLTKLQNNQSVICKCYQSWSLDEPFHDENICECECHLTIEGTILDAKPSKGWLSLVTERSRK